MVATVSRIVQAVAASRYYAKEDDLLSEKEEGTSFWFGQLTSHLAIDASSRVDGTLLEATLNGRIGEAQLGRQLDGQFVHAAGTDVEFQAPKSVSVMALMVDERLIESHDEAVKSTLGFIESDLMGTRVRQGKDVHFETTGALLAAVFRHDLSREQDPHLHSHALVHNITEYQGALRSAYLKDVLFTQQMAIGRFYHERLNEQVQALGYATYMSDKNGVFEIEGVSPSVMDRFSKRSNQIEAALAERGEDRASSSAQSRSMASLETRDDKTVVHRSQKLDEWNHELGDERSELDALKEATQPVALDSVREGMQTRAQTLLDHVIAHLETTQGAFTEGDILRLMDQLGVHRQSFSVDAKSLLAQRGDVLRLNQVHQVDEQLKDRWGQGYTTQRAMQLERQLVQQLNASHDRFQPLMDGATAAQVVNRYDEAGQALGFSPWNAEQRAALRGLMRSTDGVVGVQGLAGTAKTSTVIRSAVSELTQRGKTVWGMAPTIAATRALQAVGIDDDHNVTVQKFVSQYASLSSADKDQLKGAWFIIDEAGLVGNRLMDKVLSIAGDHQARVVAVGDVKQHGSVDSGMAFKTLIKAGLKTHYLTNIQRQTDATERQVAYQMAVGQLQQGLDTLQAQGKIQAVQGRGEALLDPASMVNAIADAVAKTYVESVQNGESVLVIDPAHESKDLTNAFISQRLGEGKAAYTITLSRRHAIGEALKPYANSYALGDRLVFRRDLKVGMQKGESWIVTGVDAKENRLTLEREKERTGQIGQGDTPWLNPGNRRSIDQLEVSPKQLGKSFEVYKTREVRVRSGDRLILHETVDGVNKGTELTVSSEQKEGASKGMRLTSENGQTLNVNPKGFNPLDYAYVKTSFAAQGATVKNALVVMDSARRNLVRQAFSYVGLTRQTDDVRVITDNVEALKTALEERQVEMKQSLLYNDQDPHLASVDRAITQQVERQQERESAEHQTETSLQTEQRRAERDAVSASEREQNSMPARQQARALEPVS